MSQLTYWHTHIAMPDYGGAGCMTIGTEASAEDAAKVEALNLAKRELTLNCVGVFTTAQINAASMSRFEADDRPEDMLHFLAAIGVLALVTKAGLDAVEAAKATPMLVPARQPRQLH